MHIGKMNDNKFNEILNELLNRFNDAEVSYRNDIYGGNLKAQAQNCGLTQEISKLPENFGTIVSLLLQRTTPF